MTIIWTGLAEMPISEIDKLIQLLSKLPGLGPRSGRRAALTLMKRREAMLLPLIDALERVADTVPDHAALVCGDRRLTFAQEDERATRLAHALAARGVGPGDHVACYLYNSIEYLEVMLAARPATRRKVAARSSVDVSSK